MEQLTQIRLQMLAELTVRYRSAETMSWIRAKSVTTAIM
jgi:hypothetical protein